MMCSNEGNTVLSRAADNCQ